LHPCERRYQRGLDAVQPVPHLVKHAAAVHLGSQPSNRMLPRLDSMSSGRCGRVLSSADELDEGCLPLEQAISMSRGVHALAKPTRRTQLLGSPRAQAGSRTGRDAQGAARSGRRERSTLSCVCSSQLVDASRLFTQTRVTHPLQVYKARGLRASSLWLTRMGCPGRASVAGLKRATPDIWGLRASSPEMVVADSDDGQASVGSNWNAQLRTNGPTGTAGPDQLPSHSDARPMLPGRGSSSSK
jgi:hypothetical protein